MWSKELCEIERSCHPHAQGILELLIAALVYALHQWQGIVDEIVHMPMLLNDILGKLLQHLFVSKVTHEVVTLLFIDYANCGSKFLEFFCYTSSDTLRTTCYDDYFILEIHICVSSLNWNLLAIIMVNHYFQVYSRHQGLNLVDEMANKSLVVVNGNVRNNID